TLPLVRAVVDLGAGAGRRVSVVAAGGIADGRGLAAALMLGADGVVVGTRFWACEESLVPAPLKLAALAAGGDDTVRQHLLDIVRQRAWPARYTGRVLRNDFVREWLGREAELKANEFEVERYQAAAKAADPRIGPPLVGGAIGPV